MIDVESGQGLPAVEERRPMTAAGSSVYATAMRQLESEQRELVRNYKLPRVYVRFLVYWIWRLWAESFW